MMPKPRRQRRVIGGRPCAHLVRFTEAEDVELRDLAASAGVSVARLLADSARGVKPVNRTVVAIELIGLRGDLGKIGSNINQIARAANMGQQIDGRDLADHVAAIDELTSRWLDVVDAHLAELS